MPTENAGAAKKTWFLAKKIVLRFEQREADNEQGYVVVIVFLSAIFI